MKIPRHIRLRKGTDRGQAEHGWLHSRHSFSFVDYHDPAHMGHSVLRVINDDIIEPGKGFGTHPHRDMVMHSFSLWLLPNPLFHTTGR